MRCESCNDSYDGEFEIEGLGMFCRICHAVILAVIGHPDLYLFNFGVRVSDR